MIEDIINPLYHISTGFGDPVSAGVFNPPRTKEDLKTTMQTQKTCINLSMKMAELARPDA